MTLCLSHYYASRNKKASNYPKKVKKSQLIRQIHILFQQRFRRVWSVHFQALTIKKLRYRYYNKRITNRDNGNVQSHDQQESKLNSTINANSGDHTLTHDKIIIIRACPIGTMVPM